MAVFRPFCGTRYTKSKDISNFVCPPYDIVGEKERNELLLIEKNNVISIELPEGNDQQKYINAKTKLDEMFSQQVLNRDAKEGYYIYQMEFELEGENLSVEGIVGAQRLTPFEQKEVLPHEFTLSKAKDDRLNLIKSCKTNISSVYSMFDDSDKFITNIIENTIKTSEPLSFCVQDGVSHRLYVIDDQQQVDMIEQGFKDKKMYIADGHHRYETGINFKNYLLSCGENVDENHPASYIMMTAVASNNKGLIVLPTHRIVRNVENYSSKDMLEKLKLCFDVLELNDIEQANISLKKAYDNAEKAFVLYDKTFYLLKLKDIEFARKAIKDRSEQYKNLDVSVLHSMILEGIMGITPENMAAGKSLSYTRSEIEAVECVDNGEAVCALLINPTRVGEIIAVADAFDKMPQKSTYFYPKLITGLVMNVLD